LWALDINGNLKWDPGVDSFGSFGKVGDVPIVGDWTGDGRMKIGIYRPSDSTFALDVNGNLAWDAGVDKVGSYGQSGDQPVVGDWTGDRKAKVGIFRAGLWALDTNGDIVWNGTDQVARLGEAGDVPLLGDWNGDHRTKIGAYHPSTATFFLDYDGNLKWDHAAVFGRVGDIPVMGDWDGSGITRIGVFRAGSWVLDMKGTLFQNAENVRTGYLGEAVAGDQPIVGRW
jgi:hypothetical protein